MLNTKLKAALIEPEALTWFESRGIEDEVLEYAGVNSKWYNEEQLWVTFPRYDVDGDILKSRIVTLRDGKPDAPETMAGQDIFYNDKGLHLAIEEQKPLVICQSEMDCLSLMQAGHAWTIAWIDGDDLLWDNQDLLKEVPSIILAGMDNEQGKEFNDIISKQIGIENCSFVVYPDECRTINDILIRYDGQTVTETIAKAQSYPVVGLYRPNEFPPIPAALKQVYPTTLGQSHNYHLKLMLGKFMVVTGVAGSGKSTWTDGLVMNLAKTHKWNVCICSTEIDNEEYQEESYHRYLGKPVEDASDTELQRAKDFYQEHFTFITNNVEDDEMELTLEKLIELAKVAIQRDGAKVLLVDPWNELSHIRNGQGESETEYTGRAIRLLKRLAKVHRVLVIVVAHPSKPSKGDTGPVNLYHINGSAHFANKADYGVVIYREDVENIHTKVIFAKIKRHGAMGYVGEIDTKFDIRTRRFNEIREN